MLATVMKKVQSEQREAVFYLTLWRPGPARYLVYSTTSALSHS